MLTPDGVHTACMLQKKFDSSATLYSQFTSANDNLGRANSFAHGRRYVKARDAYQLMLNEKSVR